MLSLLGAIVAFFGAAILERFGVGAKAYGAFELPAQVMATCFGGTDAHGSGCGYDQAAGALWDER